MITKSTHPVLSRSFIIILALLISIVPLIHSTPPIYAEDTVTATTWNELKAAISNAGSTPTTIVIPGNRYFGKTETPAIPIASDQDITITTDGTGPINFFNTYSGAIFDIYGKLTIDGVSNDLLHIYDVSEHAPWMPHYFIRLNREGEIYLSNVKIDGKGFSAVISEGNSVGSNNSKININEGTMISGCGSAGFRGGAIDIRYADITMNGGMISECVANTGGGIFLENGSITMNGGIISNNKAESGGGLYLYNAPLTLNSGIISGNVAGDEYVNDNGGGIYAFASNIVMNGGIVSSNSTNANGGGISLESSEMVMNDGGIIDNEAACYGGGVCIIGKSSLILNNGSISGNKVIGDTRYHDGSEQPYTKLGGGICIVDRNAKFEMNGGKINNNYAGETDDYSGTEHGLGYGGGIYTNSSYTFLRAGEIKGNEATCYGGGIYISATPVVAHFEKTLVTDNTATWQGGGLWLCPTGAATLETNEGMAIFENGSDRNGDRSKAIGDDIVVQSEYIDPTRKSEKDVLITLSERMLGGGLVEYWTDGAVAARASEEAADDDKDTGLYQGHVMPNASPVTRYENQTSKLTKLKNIGEASEGQGSTSISVKTIMSDNAKELAKECATLIISGNRATGGGGIGSNGSFVIGGEDDPTNPEPDIEEWSLEVRKIWKGFKDDQLPSSVTMQLVIDDRKLDKITLNKANDWKASFEHLPDPEKLKSSDGAELIMDVIENEISDPSYTVKYKVNYGDLIKVDDHTYSYEIENVFVEDTSSQDGPEAKTSNDDDKNKDNDKNTNSRELSEDSSASGEDSVTAKTGDTAKLMLFVIILALAIIAVIVIVKVRKKKNVRS